jgi:hypothetical protein
MTSENLCPVCGYEMDDPPRDYNICPCCGTEFGHHDVNASVSDLRSAWLQTGPKWWSTVTPAPENWKPLEQLANLLAAQTRDTAAAQPGTLPVYQREVPAAVVYVNEPTCFAPEIRYGSPAVGNAVPAGELRELAAV